MIYPLAFKAVEFGGTGNVEMELSPDGGNTWIPITAYFAGTSGQTKDFEETNVYTIDIDNTVFIPGNTYPCRLLDADGITVSNILQLAIPISSGGSYAYGYGSGGGIGTGNLSSIELLGLNNNPLVTTFDPTNPTAGGNVFVAYDTTLTSDMQLMIYDLTAATLGQVGSGVLTAGDYFVPATVAADIALPFIAGHKYQLVLMDPVLNPTQDLTAPSNIFSNVLTAYVMQIDSVSNVSSALNIVYNANISDAGNSFNLLNFVAPYGNGHGSQDIATTPVSQANQPFASSLGYVSGWLAQLTVADPSGNILGATTFTILP